MARQVSNADIYAPACPPIPAGSPRGQPMSGTWMGAPSGSSCNICRRGLIRSDARAPGHPVAHAPITVSPRKTLVPSFVS
jgi:hypothetical protein